MFHKIVTILLAIILCIVLEACTTQQWYEGVKMKQKNDCAKLPPSEYDACMKQTEKSYEEYEAERQEIKKQ